jgi:hypothetical protein
MSADAIISSALAASAAVQAIVSGRVYPLFRPQSTTRPAITWVLNDARRTQGVNRTTGLVRASVLLDCWADDFDASRSLANTVRLAVDGLKKQTIGGYVCDHINLESWRDSSDPPWPGEEYPIFGTSLELSVVYMESIPAN